MSDKILIVDDEVEIADLIETYLKNEDYAVYKFYSAKDALACINETELDLAVLDVMLPDADGFTICRKIREKHTYPVIMLTAKDAEAVTLKLYHRQIKIFVFLIDIFSYLIFSAKKPYRRTEAPLMPGGNIPADFFQSAYTG